MKGLDHLGDVGRRPLRRSRLAPRKKRIGRQADEPVSDLLDRENGVDSSGRDRRAGHSVDRRLIGLLDQGETARGLDLPKAGRAVVGAARQDHPDGTLPVVVGDGAKQRVDRPLRLAPGRVRTDAQVSVGHRHPPVGRDDVHVARLDRGPVPRWEHLERRGLRQQLGQDARLVVRQVLDENERQRNLALDRVEQRGEGLQPARRRADGGDEERRRL